MSNKTGNTVALLVFLFIIAIAAFLGSGLPQSMPVTPAHSAAPPAITSDAAPPTRSPAARHREAVPSVAKAGMQFMVTDKRRQHILYGDETGGGHKYGTAHRGKTEFPEDWDDKKIIGAILQVANNPNLPMRQSGRYWLKADMVEGVAVRVVLDRDKGEVVTGYPLKRNNMREIATEAQYIWQKLESHVAADDPLKADAAEYLQAGEWGIALEAMAILAKRYGQHAALEPHLTPLMEQVMLAEEDDVVMASRQDAQKYAALNRRAKFDYAIEDKMEAGLMLTGTEVKALRAGGVNIAESYAGVSKGEIYLFNANFAEYAKAGVHLQHDARRPRKLLLHKRQAAKLIGAIQREGATLIPLSIYFNPRGIAKMELGVAKGKRKEDKRATIKEREWKREQARAMKTRGRE